MLLDELDRERDMMSVLRKSAGLAAAAGGVAVKGTEAVGHVAKAVGPRGMIAGAVGATAVPAAAQAHARTYDQLLAARRGVSE